MKKRGIVNDSANVFIKLARFSVKRGVGVFDLKGHVETLTNCLLDCAITFVNRVLDNKEA